jgi:hypothetical protein
MDILEKFLHSVAYKFPKGYPDMNNEQDINLLASLLEGLGIDLSDLIMKAASEKLDAQDLEKWISDNFKDSFKEL